MPLNQTFIISEAPAGETFVFVVACFGWQFQEEDHYLRDVLCLCCIRRVGWSRWWHDVTFEDFTSQKPCRLTWVGAWVRTVSLLSPEEQAVSWPLMSLRLVLSLKHIWYLWWRHWLRQLAFPPFCLKLRLSGKQLCSLFPEKIKTSMNYCL